MSGRPQPCEETDNRSLEWRVCVDEELEVRQRVLVDRPPDRWSEVGELLRLVEMRRVLAACQVNPALEVPDLSG